MKRNFDVVVKDFDGFPKVRTVFAHDDKGLPILEPNGAQKRAGVEAMTLRIYALDALHGRWPGEEGMSHEDSWKRMKLADKLAFATDGVVELTVEEGQMILTALKNQGREHLVVGRMKDLLDTDPTVSTDKPA